MHGHRRDSAICPSGGEGEPHGRGRDLGGGGCALGLGAAILREPTTREQVEGVRPPAAGDGRQFLTAGTFEKQFDGSDWFPGFEQNAGQPHRSPGGDEAFVEVASELDALLGGAEGDVHLAHCYRHDRAVEQVPHESLRVARQMRSLDSAVQELGGVGQLGADIPDPAEDLVQDGEELPLAGRTGESEGTAGVPVGLGIAVEVELGGSKPDRRVEAAGQLVVGEAVNEGRGRGAAGLSALASPGHRVRECRHRQRRRRQGRIAKFSRGGFRTLGPVAHRLVFRPVELVERELDEQPDELD